MDGEGEHCACGGSYRDRVSFLEIRSDFIFGRHGVMLHYRHQKAEIPGSRRIHFNIFSVLIAKR